MHAPTVSTITYVTTTHMSAVASRFAANGASSQAPLRARAMSEGGLGLNGTHAGNGFAHVHDSGPAPEEWAAPRDAKTVASNGLHF